MVMNSIEVYEKKEMRKMPRPMDVEEMIGVSDLVLMKGLKRMHQIIHAPGTETGDRVSAYRNAVGFARYLAIRKRQDHPITTDDNKMEFDEGMRIEI